MIIAYILVILKIMLDINVIIKYLFVILLSFIGLEYRILFLRIDLEGYLLPYLFHIKF